MMLKRHINKKIYVLQINLGHRIIAHDALMVWLAVQHHEWILCIQEPYFSKKGITKIPKEYGVYWFESKINGAKRATVITPRGLNRYMVTQHSNKDCVTVRFDDLNISVISLYCALDIDMQESIENLVKEKEKKQRVICCMDANAYHAAWGSDLVKNTKWAGKIRGIDLMYVLDELGMHVCNEPPHPPTFIRDTKRDHSHIDITTCAGCIFNQIREWQVTDETFGSDHVGITFTYTTQASKTLTHDTHIWTPWKQPSQKMNGIMKVALGRAVTSFGSIKHIHSVENAITQHTTHIVTTLEKVFRKNRQRKTRVYWWNKEVAEKYRLMKIARRRMRKYRHDNLRQEFNQRRWEFREVVNNVKIQAWRTFTSHIADPWDKLIKIVKATMTGRIQSRTLCNIHREYASNMDDTLHLLSKQFYPAPEPLLDIHKDVERHVDELLSNVCIRPKITLCELNIAVGEMSANTAPGFDRITNNVIAILTTQRRLRSEYLQLFNLCLRHSYFPHVWKTAKIVLIPKSSDNLDSTKAFRPISLTSAFAKLFERIMLTRLMHYLTLSNAMVSNQHAYNKGRSTQTALYELFNIAQYATQRKGMCIVVFLDISGAFDRTWHYGILHKLLQYNVPKYLVSWIKAFLSDRTAVFIEGGEVHEKKLSQGCPQGGVLSPILWNVLFNEVLGLPMCSGRKKSDCLRIIGYADDAALICKADSMNEIENMLNQQLEIIRQWAVRNRVKFNPQKLASITLCNKKGVPPAARLFYDTVPINSVETYKYLGLQVDRRLLWNVHINGVITKLALVTRSLWGLAREGWGVRLDIFRTLFHSIFMPIMTYGIAIWGWKTTSNVIGDRFNREIRKYALMATRCQKTTASTYLFVLLKAQPFAQVLINEVTKVSISQLRIKDTRRSSVYENYEKRRKTRIIPQCMDQHFYMLRKGLGMNAAEIEFSDVNKQYFVHPSKWVINKVIIRDSINALIDSIDVNRWVIFTDASASSYGFGWGYVAYKYGISRMSCYGSLSQCSIFMAEAYAVLQAIRYVNTIEGLGKKEIIEIRCDAHGVLMTLRKSFHVNVIFSMIHNQLRIARSAGRNILFRWVPSHQDVCGNECADRLAKRGVDAISVTYMPITDREAQLACNKRKNLKINNMWDNFHSANIKAFLPNMSAVRSFILSIPSVAVCQIVSGHSRLNDFVHRILCLKDSPMCACGTDRETVSHFVFHCPLHEPFRQEIWSDFQCSFDYIARDWEKFKVFVHKTRRFEGRVINKGGELGGKRAIAL